MKTSWFLQHGLTVACLALTVPVLSAQNTTIQLFGPVNVRSSVTGTTYDAPNTFNSTTLNLTCPASPTATLSSANGGNILVDNNIQVSTSSPSITAQPMSAPAEHRITPRCAVTQLLYQRLPVACRRWQPRRPES